jgi:nitric oxide reductase subunit C
MFAPHSKKILMTALVASFGVQSWLVYTDTPAESPLSEQALHGRQLWHQHNCQSCHQFYGFGGFLGPDLTNASPQLADARLSLVLTKGANAMPAYNMTPDEVAAMHAFLDAMHATGRGQARIPPPPGADEWAGTAFEPFYRALAEELRVTAPHEEVRRGLELYQRNSCQACHYPLTVSPLNAPDLTLVTGRLDVRALDEVLEHGRPGTTMPPSGLDADERAELIRFMAWMNRQRDVLERRLAGTERPRIVWSEIPWWEYK